MGALERGQAWPLVQLFERGYCTIGNRECDSAQVYLQSKGYSGPFLHILLEER